ncbi:hypothetical protein CFRA_03430 [Corynebacterium frankenforstense DSM 45800]|uniref:Uncharacterized protein n=2 Tax=Corynebacterium TaxID=1716 RepID=A0A1L7CRL0_9CORY|nr:hypothetical protein CFRA_03430 [Corynebacterium frankenforstense DSM 45800]
MVMIPCLALAACSGQNDERSGASADGSGSSGVEAADRFTGEVGDFTIHVTDLGDPSEIAEVEMPDYDGMKQVSVSADVTNNGAKEIDLACGFDLDVRIFSNGESWGNVGYLERVPGNPSCEDHLKPGETQKMTWVSIMPSEKQPTDLEVEDTSDPNAYAQIKVR